MIKLFRTKENDHFLRAIENASDEEITEIIAALIRRYSRLHPEWEILFLSLPKEPTQRRRQLELMLEKLHEGTLGL